MSQEKYNVLAQLAETFGEEGFDAVLRFATPDFEFHEPPEQPGATVFHGPEEARAGFARWAETWVDQRSDLEKVEELEDGRILVFTLERMRGRDGIEVSQQAAHLISFRDDGISRLASYWDRDNARRAAGLSE